MRRAAAVFLLFAAFACAQGIVPPNGLARVRGDFEPRPGEESLRCEVIPIPPAVNYAFRFEAGYTFYVPRAQYTGPSKGWIVLTSITPERGDPTYLFAHTSLAKAAAAGPDFIVRGVYVLGAGRYSVEAVLHDDRDRVCRKRWNVVVTPSRAERGVPLALPPYAVRTFAPVFVPDTTHPDETAPMRLSVLLNAASFSSRRITIDVKDRERIADVLTALVERIPVTSVRVVVFSLEQQKEVFHADSFRPADVRKIAAAIQNTPQTTVDLSVLKNPLGYVDFLASLIRRETDAAEPADAVIFAGPASRYWDKGPKSALPSAGQARTAFWNLRFEAWLRLGTKPDWTGNATEVIADPDQGLPDIISRAVAQLNGKTIIIHSPADLAAGIRKIEGGR